MTLDSIGLGSVQLSPVLSESMNYIFSQHSLDRLVERQISMELAKEVIENADEVVENEDGLTVFQALKVFPNGKNYLVRVYVNEEVDPSLVVTVFRTSNIKKYSK